MGKIYFTLTGTKHYFGKEFLKKGTKIRLEKELDNEYDKEAIKVTYEGLVLLISQFVTNQICSHVTDLPSFVSLAFLYNPADFLPDYLFHLQCYI